MYSDRVGAEGVSPDEVAALASELRRVHEATMARSEGEVGAEYASLALHRHMPASLDEIEAAAQALQGFADVLLIGIGGSSLGAKAVRHALRPDNGGSHLHFVENVDPYELHHLLGKLDPAQTALICVSKSGGTIETLVQYLILRDWLTKHLGAAEARKRQWLVTDPKEGWLRQVARRDGLATLPIPPRIGGRYSVLSAAGLLPLAVIGVDIRGLLAGAADNAARCVSAEVGQNPALEMAALYFLLDAKKGKRISIMMPYVNRLQLFVDWYCQLWAESLGKWTSTGAAAGTLPVRAMGAVDQHSQLQMYLESRNDKMFTFVELTQWENNMPIPLDDDKDAFAYLQGRSMADVIDAEFRATRSVITEAGHPNLTLVLPHLDAHVLGQLIDLYQRTTVYAGLLYGVNPLDQPSVEKGKKLALRYLSTQGG
jgi:glucose-6-phosphate isomerase